MTQLSRILVVDDDAQLTRVLRTVLKSNGYEVRTSPDGAKGLAAFNEWQPDLVVTDLAMPIMDGLALCRSVRALSDVPIIILSAKGDERMKVEALDAGADDYVTKPFGMDELVARVRVALRRTRATEAVTPTTFTAGDFEVDLAVRSVHVRGRALHLTPKEYDLLLYFLRHAGSVLTHRTLLTAVWDGNCTEQTEYLRVFVGNLRKKIEADSSKPKYILTEPWVGYRFDTGS